MAPRRSPARIPVRRGSPIPFPPLVALLVAIVGSLGPVPGVRGEEPATATATPTATPAEETRRFEEPWNIRSRSTSVIRDAAGARLVSFIDDVLITHGDLTATCDEARYVEGSQLALLTGHVVMIRDSTVVRGPVAHYARDRRVARFPRGIVIERPTGTAIANSGTWWRDEGRFELRGRAAAADTSGTLDANAMTYDEAGEAFWAVGDARMVDDVSGVLVEGQNLRWDRAEGLAVATGDPSTTFEEDDGVPVRVTAERLTYDPDDRLAVATGDVRITRETMEGWAQRAFFYRAVNRAILDGEPTIVDGTTAIAGDRIRLDAPEPGRRIVKVTGAAQVSNRFLETRARPEAPTEGDLGPVAPLDEEAGPSALADALAPLDGEAGPVVPEGLRERIDEAGRRLVEEVDSAAVDSLRDALPGEVEDLAADLSGSPRERVARSLDEAAEAIRAMADSSAAAAAADSAATGAPADTTGAEEDAGPPWLSIPSDRLPTENLLFGDEITITFVDDAIRTVEVIGHGRSKFFPNESTGELTEWNDVTGDTLHVWFTDAAVDSVTVLGNGSGEYRLPAGDAAGASSDVLKERGKLVEYHAPRIRYGRATETMHLDRGSEVKYKDMVLKAGEIDFEATKEIMTAGGDPAPILVDAGDEIFGNRMLYHLPSQKGEIVSGRTKFENAYYQGTDIWKMGEDVLAVQDAAYTTCDLEHPHYHFASKQMKIYLDDKVVAKPVVLKIREIPVFALPFYMASLRKGRQSGFLLPNLELGVDDNRGRFIRNLGYYWAPNDYLDLTSTFDFYPSQDRIVSYLNGRYKLRYRYDGRATLKYNRDVPNNRKDTAFELEHRQTLSETMTLNGSARFVSTSSIYQDIDDDQRLDRDIRSHATFTKKFPGSNRSFRAEVERRENLDTGSIDETLPILVFSQPNRPLSGRSTRPETGEDGETETGLLDEVYYRLDSRFARLRTKSVATDDTVTETQNTGAKTDVSLTTSRKLLPHVQIRPSGHAETAWVDEGSTGEKNLTRVTYNAAVSADTKLYGTVLRKIGPVRGLRHVFEPRVSWNWAPDFREYFTRDENGNLQDRFTAFGGIGVTQRKTNRMSFSLGNLFQTKLARGEEENRYEFLNLGQSISYDFLARDEERKPWTNLSSSLRVLSSQPINQTWNVTHDPYDWNLISSSVTTRVTLDRDMLQRFFARSGEPGEGGEGPGGEAGPGGPAGDGAASGRDPFEDPGDLGPGSEDDLGARPGVARGRGRAGQWRLDVSHTARRGGTSNLVFNSDWSPTDRWSVSYMTEYDLEEGENTRQTWSVNRTIHCWQLSFDRRLLGGEWQYYLRINVTDLPDIQAERGDSFRGRSTTMPGSGFF